MRMPYEWTDIGIVEVREAALPRGDGVKRVAHAGDDPGRRHDASHRVEPEEELPRVLDGEYEVVTRHPRPIEPAPRGARRVLDHLAPANFVLDRPSSADIDTQLSVERRYSPRNFFIPKHGDDLPWLVDRDAVVE